MIKEIPAISFLKGTGYNLYVGPKLSWFERRKLRRIESQYDILYLYDYADVFTAKKLAYNFPGVRFPEGFSIKTIFDNVRKSIGEGISPESKLFIRHDGLSFVVIGSGTARLSHAISCLAEADDFNAPLPCSSHVAESNADYIDDSDVIKYHQVDESVLVSDDVLYTGYSEACENLEMDMSILAEPEPEPCMRFRTSPGFSVAEGLFDTEMMKAAAEVRKAIDSLLMTGFPVDIIQSWITENITLSRIRITKQFKIMLVDYGKEIKLGPLPKTVFFFYLRHPEGVRFTYLQDYAEELLHIYGHVSVNDDPVKMRESIASLTDPFNNSICEKCAAIKKAFILQVKDNIAMNYYVTGMQGGKKGIALDRNLVEWECVL